jgi:gamma-glutamylcyclotransferase (GGCT)/AIG2-like uncharacterized protein YtfP
MTPVPLFLYGTLRDPDILAAVLGRTVADRQLIAATAPDCVAVYFPGRVYPALLRRPGSAAPGLLLVQASADDLIALDAFEGDEYRRGSVQAMIAAGPVAAEVYWPAVPVAPSAVAWTLDHWIREHKPQVLARETELGRAARLGTTRR